MELKIFFTVFFTIFLGELGDKSQLATLLFSTDSQVSKWVVFAASSLALVCATALGVMLGSALSAWINEKYLSYVSGATFILVGLFVIARA